MTTEKVPTSCRRQFHVRAKENPNDVVKEHSKDLLYGAILKKERGLEFWWFLNFGWVRVREGHRAAILIKTKAKRPSHCLAISKLA